MTRLRKTTVGRRCDQKTLPQRFLAQPDGQHGLRPCAANAAQFSSSLFAFIRVHSRLKHLGHQWFECMDPSATFVFKIRIRVHPRLKKALVFVSVY
jgi:hypothetical protein